MKLVHQAKFLFLCTVAILLYACSSDPDMEETVFKTEDKFTKVGFAGQHVKLVVSRNNSTKDFPLKSDLIVLFGTAEAEIDTVKIITSTILEVDVIVPSGYLDETVDVTVKTLADEMTIGHFENAFTFKTPQIIEVQQEASFDSTFRIKIINRPTNFQDFYIPLQGVLTHRLKITKIEGDYLWLKLNTDWAIIKFNGYQIKADINEKLKIESSDQIFFRPSFKTEKRISSEKEVLVVIAFNASSTPPVVKLNDITLEYRWSWVLSSASREFVYTIPEDLPDGPYTINVTQNDIPFIPLEGNTYTYIFGPGPG